MLQLWDVLRRPRKQTKNMHAPRNNAFAGNAFTGNAFTGNAFTGNAFTNLFFPRLWLAALLHTPAMVDTLSAQRCLCRQCLCRHCYGALTFMQAVPVPLHLCRRCAFAGDAISGIICPVSVLL